MNDIRITVRAPINIALIKYWGKRDENLILPLNNSISITLSSDIIGTTTTITASTLFTETTLTINGDSYPMNSHEHYYSRIWSCINQAKTLAIQSNSCSMELIQCHLKIDSINDIPTAAGLASSASGYAALSYALIHLYDLRSKYPMNSVLSSIARLGSGSACRSLLGGFVEWEAGSCPNGSDCIIKQLAPSSWMPTNILIITFSASHIPKKHISSTIGMSDTVSTSTLFPYRTSEILPKRLCDLRMAIQTKDFSLLSKITMQDAAQFHAVCMDTWPPIIYLNDFSYWIIRLVHYLNNPEYDIAYTFDAGPYPVLLFQSIPRMIQFITCFNKLFKLGNDRTVDIVGSDPSWSFDSNAEYHDAPCLSFPYANTQLHATIYYCTVGNGPIIIDSNMK